jgi:DUF1365 family protein
VDHLVEASLQPAHLPRPMRSQIFECSILHARFLPRAHRFLYRIFMLSLDLDELAEVHQRLRLFSINGRNLFSLHERDFLPLTSPPHNPSAERPDNQYGYNSTDTPTLKQRVLAYLRHHDVAVENDARVELITLPRMLGYRFNPVSFYFVRNAAGDPVAAITEITNTFHEMKPFLLRPETMTSDGFKFRVPKNFYVSPFTDVDVEFDFRLRVPSNRLAIQIDDYIAGQRTLTTSLTGPARPLTDGTLAWFLLKYPLLTFRIIFLIHWHALRLWIKRVPWFAKAARPTRQTDLYRPHKSLADK